MKNGVILLIFLGILLGESIAVAEEVIAFQVIVHVANPVQHLSKQEISQAFLKKVKAVTIKLRLKKMRFTILVLR